MTSGASPAAARVTCDDCVFRQKLLCALPGNTVCPTFRAAEQTPALHAVAEPEPKPVAA